MDTESRVRQLSEKQAELERKKQWLLQGDPMGTAEDRKAFMKAMDARDGYGFTWLDLLSLVLICQGRVPDQAIAHREAAYQVLQQYQPKKRGTS
ncbi:MULTISPECIES: hypothetical protein [Acidithiobacillus]|uniref:Uncharacterized protein n=1 Tax=Acidithiobacillus thiooxidans TaxID=930 RepID=A0A1C2ID37_ACITH|nr:MULTISPECIES: hypothetical protein [Acidithiobacillus]MBE7567622.1 hypothetical protein [Acidithiobacillus sp. HP-11]MBU2743552.1 hypothetical protein [Acidithiobacillus albertensis]MBU2750171.1 hypothetical protein [Acidithiobacillus thiooxidans]MBU2794877.1 hypothetical protein [Acidithiobacillus thiooxidans]MBU2843304.1 hypothetical protein [Acidithiobacillus thiooxidans]